jgi:N-acetyl-gamma-glutamyl-phosphate reductase
MDRGICETIYCQPLKDLTRDELEHLYGDFYAAEPFVRVLNCPPKTKDVAFTNFCDIFAAPVKGKVVVFSTIDNLIKGAAGQAVQNLNLICNLPETMGLL